jgi:superfamily II DNA or RNA helicase
LTPPHYVDPETASFGRLDADVPAPVAGVLLQAPGLGPDDAAAFRREAERRLGESLPVWPSVAKHSTTREITPTPVLRLFTAKKSRQTPLSATLGIPPAKASSDADPVPAAGLWFEYAGHTVAIDASQETLKWQESDTLVQVPRDTDAEEANAFKVLESGLQLLPLDWSEARRLGVGEAFFAAEESQGLDIQLWLEFLDTMVPTLEAEGWRVEVADDFPYKVLRPDGACHLDIDSPSGIDWFGVALGVRVDGEDVDLLPIIQTIMKQPQLLDPDNAPEPDQDAYVPLGDGRYVVVKAERLAEIARMLQGLLDAGGEPGQSRIPPARLGDLAMLEPSASEDFVVTGGERLRELARALTDTGEAGVQERPARLQGELRGYQAQGLRWLQVLARHGFGGILADDMGLGKTIQALAHILMEKEAGRLDAPCLIVAPTSVVPTWFAEAQRFAPDLETVAIRGKARADSHTAAVGADLVITSYALLRQDRTHFAGRDYAIVICDEAQALKNPRAQAAAIVRELRARQVICLTGTPLENSLEDLWSLMNLTVPAALGDRKAFRQTFRTPIENHSDSQRREQLSRRVRPFLLRRRKADVAADLPARTEIEDTVPLNGAQRDLYETVRASMDARVREAIRAHGLKRSQITVLEALLKLRQVCCDPRLLDAEAARRGGKSAKLERLRALLDDLLAAQRRVLVFSQFTSMLDLIEAQVQAAGIGYCRLDGSTADRETPVRRFQAGEMPVFLVSLKAGGTGLNLTAADTVIHYDPWWNPAVSAQATDRAHRIGQDKPVFVYHLIAEGTVEARIRELQARKRDLAAFIETEGTQGGGLDEADVDMLLAPLGA